MCLREYNLQDYCLTTVNEYSTLAPDFQFICNHRPRDEKLIRSLQCIHDKRLLVTLYFDIMDHCDHRRGFDFLHYLIIGTKNVYFYSLDVPSLLADWLNLPLLYCLPEYVLRTCISQLVDDRCGAMAADLMQDYVLFTQEWVDHALQHVGWGSNRICEHDISSLHRKIGLPGMMQISAPETALDTIRGRLLMDYLGSLPVQRLCTARNAYDAYTVCVMSSEGRSDENRFNILQFAHEIIPINYHGAHCNRLEQFTACWNLLQETCGPYLQGLEHHATLLVDGCQLQSDMDIVRCPWQEILLPYYIQASKLTAWPLSVQCLHNPMWLDKEYYNRTVTKNLGTVISFLQPGVKEISRRCGQDLGNRLQFVLDKLGYFQYDAWRYSLALQTPPY